MSGAIFAFTCACCGERHEGSPSFGYDAPAHYSEIAESQKSAATLTGDTCVIHHDDGGVDRFIRVVLEIPIHGVPDPFLWGVWVSLSEASFARYLDTWNDPDESDAYFGWFSNRLPYYPDTLNLKSTVHPRKGRARPWLQLEPTDHPLAVHARNGLTIDEAQRIAEVAMHGTRH